MFQNTVRNVQTTGIVGEPVSESPRRVEPWIINSSASGETNLVGLVYTKVADGEVTVGGTGPFIGILVGPKEYALQGDGAGTLNPSLELQDGEVGQFMKLGDVYVNLVGSGGNVDDPLKYNETTGVIGVGAPGAGESAIPNSKIILEDIPAAGLAAIELTN